MNTIQKTATATFGSVAVFNYSGVPHVAVVIGQGFGEFYIRESNYGGDFIGERTVKFNDPALVGFLP